MTDYIYGKKEKNLQPERKINRGYVSIFEVHR